MCVPHNVVVPHIESSLTNHFYLLVNCQGVILYPNSIVKWFMQYSNVLFRMQGFVSTMQNLCGFAPTTMYDIIIVISKDLSAPTMLHLFKGLPLVG